MNTTAQKNELIFGYSSGNLGEAKSLFTSMYLYLNSVAAKQASIFDNMLAQNLSELKDVRLKKLKYTDCIKKGNSKKQSNNLSNNPLSRLIGDLNHIDWKTIYKGFKEFKIPVNDNDTVKLIKMDTGTSVPLHSHNGKEYILYTKFELSQEPVVTLAPTASPTMAPTKALNISTSSITEGNTVKGVTFDGKSMWMMMYVTLAAGILCFLGGIHMVNLRKKSSNAVSLSLMKIDAKMSLWIFPIHLYALFIPLILLPLINENEAFLSERIHDQGSLFYAVLFLMAGSFFEICQNHLDEWYVNEGSASGNGYGLLDGL